MTYVDGFVVPVPEGKINEYKKMAAQAGKIWMEHGALAYVECVGEDMEDKGFCKTFPNAFKTKDGETVVFAYIVYKSRAHRDKVNKKVMADERLKCDPDNMPFDCKRMAYGGFKALVAL
ncbi:MAG: DUF1428 domain-containing protein [Alphaproteobacteria bacterium]|nr:DUF1428 domain-containing protein [Alphaproteobacteria bacterium]MBP7759126.1 DUF1428 domain-containing protein [Alphaproteobacteria bacterium]MBP7762490.1 DUF1428 domain-containing protein [Alphaproteobacteria bacterium]MBP7905583.1 DUF1428 domain-containing protein [Alphaproteobacteria bacterium]